jgi:carbon monoxide dehydrogenase subunit G
MALRCESTVTVAAPPETVFPWLLEADKVPQWMTGLEVYEPLAPGPLQVGSRIRQHLAVSGQQLKFELEIVELAPPARAVLRFEGSGFKAANEYAVAAAPGGAAVTWVISGDTTSFKAKLIAPMVQAKLQEKLDGDLARLRALLEGEAAAA